MSALTQQLRNCHDRTGLDVVIEAAERIEELERQLAAPSAPVEQAAPVTSEEVGEDCVILPASVFARFGTAQKYIQHLEAQAAPVTVPHILTESPYPEITGRTDKDVLRLCAEFLQDMHAQPVERTISISIWLLNEVQHALAAAPAPSADAQDANDTKRLNFLTEFGSTWHVQWEKRGNNPVRYRMIEDGEAWGKWHPTPRAAIDAALAAQKEGE